MKKYDKETEENMVRLFSGMDERTKRLYAATESKKLGHGGINYISELLGISTKTIYNGKKELKELNENNDDNPKRIRKVGGGRKKKRQQNHN